MSASLSFTKFLLANITRELKILFEEGFNF